jgi:hypothetical protein
MSNVSSQIRKVVWENNGSSFKPKRKACMSRPNIWAPKVAALVQGGNHQAALAQIKVAPSVRDVQQLRDLLLKLKLLANNRSIDQATSDQIDALSAPRLHRSP